MKKKKEWISWCKKNGGSARMDKKLTPSHLILQTRCWLKQTYELRDINIRDRLTVNDVLELSPFADDGDPRNFGKIVTSVFEEIRRMVTKFPGKKSAQMYVNLGTNVREGKQLKLVKS